MQCHFYCSQLVRVAVDLTQIKREGHRLHHHSMGGESEKRHPPLIYHHHPVVMCGRCKWWWGLNSVPEHLSMDFSSKCTSCWNSIAAARGPGSAQLSKWTLPLCLGAGISPSSRSSGSECLHPDPRQACMLCGRPFRVLWVLRDSSYPLRVHVEGEKAGGGAEMWESPNLVTPRLLTYAGI